MKSLWLKIERCLLFNVIRFFRIRGASEKVARGFTLGMVVNFFPTFGFGVLISGFFAYLLKYALPILIPFMVIISLLFFSRGRVF